MQTKTPPFDFIFISYDEPKAEENWLKLKSVIPNAKRVHGVEGIARAWKKASELATTSHFFTMDGDSQIKENFFFELNDFQGENDQRVHVYRCLNGVNGLVYGYGSIHLFPTQLVRDFKDLDVVDFTLNVATHGFCIQPKVASTTCFNTSAYISWKSGFREASKLASQTNAYIGTKPDPRSLNRLVAWTSLGADVEFGDWCLLGARMGALFGFEFKNQPEQLSLISNHEWFRAEFQKISAESLSDNLASVKDDLKKYDFRCFDFNCDESATIKKLMNEV